MATSNVEIRTIDTTEGFEKCADLQQAVWDFEDREIVPVNELTAIRHSGGVVLGAWETKNEEDELVGFVFGILGRRDFELIHVSRMMGVIPNYRESDVAYRLKCTQRQHVLEQHIDQMTWTFDPLLSVNAYFNIEKLGAEVDAYKESVYGNSTSWMNQGWETDRFVLTWNLDSERVQNRVDDGEVPERDINTFIDSDGYTFINDVEFDYNQIPHPDGANLDYQRNNLLVEIPRNISFIKSQDLDLAREWRQHTRKIFNEYLRRGYKVKAFVSGKVEEPRFYRSLYVLDR
jgi:predicted GNAT superfamily acetyltransferase